MQKQKHYIAIACEILYREVCFSASQSKNIVDVVFQTKGLHDIGEAAMSKGLQDAINQVDHTRYDAILLVYGLCNNGIRNLHAPIPLVVPRAHDCITLLMGSKEKYAGYFANNPGAYYHSSGWLERNVNSDDNTINQLGIGKSYEQYAAEFGDENAEYLMEMLGSWLVNYNKLAFINNGIGDVESNMKKSQSYAKSNNWDFEEVKGDINLFERLVNGDWDEKDFLVIPPQHKIVPSNDDGVITYISETPC